MLNFFKKKYIIAVTGSRADYGLLYFTLNELNNSKKINLKLLVTGSHLSKKHGYTINEIIKDKFKKLKKIDLKLQSKGEKNIAVPMSAGIKKFSEFFLKDRPNLILILGDRYESFAAAIAAYTLKIPIAHIHGGEITEGAYDEAFRHSITKMSQIHFTSTNEYRNRIIQLGENPKSVFNFGAPGVENIKKLNLLSLKSLEKKINFRFTKKNLLICFHPVTLEDNTSEEHIKNIIYSLDKLKETNLIFTSSNVDTGGSIINNIISDYVKKNNHKAILFSSLGQLKYLSVLKYVDGIIGNSSSGIIEAPSLKTGTINIGDRQLGRVQAKSIINCSNQIDAINISIRKLFSKSYKNKLLKVINPYEKNNVSKKIMKQILKTDFNNLIKKRFYDI